MTTARHAGTDPFSPAGSASDRDLSISLDRPHLVARTFLLGNDDGFVLHEPVAQNTRDATLLPVKWFGASGFGHKYFEANRVWLVMGGERVKLDRSNQVGFVQHLDRAERTFSVDGCTVRQTFFVPDGLRAFVMALEAGREAAFIVEPQFDMRYYQAFNTDFSRYAADVETEAGVGSLHVSNLAEVPHSVVGPLEFHSIVRPLSGVVDVRLLPETQRLRHRTYLKDERRDRVIHSAYAETCQTEETSPDEAPIWDTYGTTIYAAAEISGSSPLTLVYAFGDRSGDARACLAEVCSDLNTLERRKLSAVTDRLETGSLVTGDADVDCAYAQVLTRFNSGLVARDMTVLAGPGEKVQHYSAIFAGNKYFLDAWKRDENISLGGLLLTGDFATVRAILDNTWQFQNRRTGRLPHIIRLGEPLVYYSSDGTLWALRRLHDYTRASGDGSLLDAKYEMVEHFFSASLHFVRRGLLPSGGIIDRAYLWETWEDTPYTPRDGYPVEIELLWLTALDNYLPLIRDRNPSLAERLAATLEQGRRTFELFCRDGYLVDSLDYQWNAREILTPNGYVAFELDYPLSADLRRSLVLLGREQLAGRRGVRGLAWRDWPGVLSPEFLADPRNVQGHDMASVGLYNYHRGIEWLWFNQFFVKGELSCGDAHHAYARYVSGLVHLALHEGGIGGLPELYDLHGPLGADFQAWSMTDLIACLHAFAGVDVDAVARRVQVRPAPPDRFPGFRCRRRVGDTRFDVHFLRGADGSQTLDVRALDPVPPDHTLRLGARVPAGARPGSIALNGSAVPPERWTFLPGCAAEVDGEVWVETSFTSHTVAVFSSTGGTT